MSTVREIAGDRFPHRRHFGSDRPHAFVAKRREQLAQKQGIPARGVQASCGKRLVGLVTEAVAIKSATPARSAAAARR